MSGQVTSAQSMDKREWMPVYALVVQGVSTFFIIIRIWARCQASKSKWRLGLDDVLVIFGWLLGSVMTALVLVETLKLGFDRHQLDVPSQLWSQGAFYGWLIEIFFFLSTCFIKISILLFYVRLVAGTHTKRFKVAVWIGLAFVLLYTLSFTILLFTDCRPLEARWKQFDPTFTKEFHCLPQTILAPLSGSLSCFSDLFSVLIPVFIVSTLSLDIRQKLGLITIFGIGFLVVAAGAVRTAFLNQALSGTTLDVSWVSFNAFAAAIAEVHLAIIYACAPSIKRVFGGGRRRVREIPGSKSFMNLPNTGSSRSDSRMVHLRTDSRRALRETQTSFDRAHELGISSDPQTPVVVAYDTRFELQRPNAAANRNSKRSTTSSALSRFSWPKPPGSKRWGPFGREPESPVLPRHSVRTTDTDSIQTIDVFHAL